MEPNSGDVPTSKQIKEEVLLELAKKELLRDIKCAAVRAEQYGAHSWAKKTQKYVPSKRFLHHMIVNDSRFNDRKEQKSHEKRKRDRHRQSSSYPKTEIEKSDQKYSSDARNKNRTTPSESVNIYGATKSEKSFYNTKEYDSKNRKHKNYRHSPPKSKHRETKSKKHPKDAD